MAITATDLQQLAQTYTQIFPEEQAALQGFLEHSRQQDEKIFSRKTVPGHVTAAGFVRAKDTGRVLLIEHAFLRLYLQPGGHFEPEDTDTLAAAKREIEEETGLTDANLTYLPLLAGQPHVPLDIEVQAIPANPNKHEGAHNHYDFRYFFTVDEENDIVLNAQESTAFRWTDWEAFKSSEPGFRRVADKVEQRLSLKQ